MIKLIKTFIAAPLVAASATSDATPTSLTELGFPFVTKFLPNFHRNLDIHLIEKNFHLINEQKNNFHLNIFDHLNFKWHKHFEYIIS